MTEQKYQVEFQDFTLNEHEIPWWVHAEVTESLDHVGYKASIKSINNGLFDEDLTMYSKDTMDELEQIAIEVFVEEGGIPCVN